MDHIGQDQHPDAVAEIGQRLGQGLAVLATLGEAAARLAAEEMRRRERREQDAERYGERLHREQERQQRAQRRRERDKARNKQPDDQLAQHAEGRRAASRDRRLIAQTLDPEWFDRADLFDLATVWRAARLREGEFPEARIAAEHVEQRLRDMYPRAMDGYDQAVARGASRAAAMRAAAYAMAQTRPARPHRGRRSSSIESGPNQVIGTEGLDAAVGQERERLAHGLPQAGYAEELERLGAGGVAAAQALREILEARAGEQLRHSQAVVAVPDDPATAGVDEHTTGLDRNASHVGEGNRDQADARTAAQLAAEWYPDGLDQAGVLPAHLARRQPATTRTQAQAGKPTTARAR